MDGTGDDDGYAGRAVLAAGGQQFDVHVELRGLFQPIDGRYHWYGRIARHDGLAAALGSSRGEGVLTTPEGSAPCELSDPDPWQRYRITGISTPPFTPFAPPVTAADPPARSPAPGPRTRTRAPGTAAPPQ
jgi:Domain of unknown function (DUF4873)